MRNPRRRALAAVAALALSTTAMAACSPGDVREWLASHKPPKPPPTTTTTGAPPSSTTTTLPATSTTSPGSTTTTVPPSTTSTSMTTTTTTAAPGANGCALNSPAFCETFDQPHPGSTPRGGDLADYWGVSRTGGDSNLGQGTAEHWASFPLELCGSTQVVAPPRDVQICGGRLHEGLDDEHGVKSLAMYPKQPMDFAGRTGRITFDVSNDTQGSHAAWPELWMSDKPVPAPFTHEGSFAAIPQHGFGLRFAGCTDGNGNKAGCSRGDTASTGVESAEVVRNFVEDDSEWEGTLRVIGVDSVIKSGAGQLNHYEVTVAQDRIEVYASDPFTGAWDPAARPLRLIAYVPNAALSFTRGLVWIEDAHYNGSKMPGTDQQAHTFVWDNVGFDGPKTYRDFAYDVPMRDDGSGNTGWALGPGSTLPLAVDGVAPAQTPTGAHVDFQWFAYDQAVPSVRINGGPWHTTPWPFDAKTYTNRTVSVPVAVSEVVAGHNTIEFASDFGVIIHDVDLILVAAGAVP